MIRELDGSEGSNDSAKVAEIEGLGESGVKKHDMLKDPMDDTNTNSTNLSQNELGPDKEDSTDSETDDSDDGYSDNPDETAYDYPYGRHCGRTGIHLKWKDFARGTHVHWALILTPVDESEKTFKRIGLALLYPDRLGEDGVRVGEFEII